MPRVRNPFRPSGYNDPYMAEVAQNISGFLLGGESPYEAQARRAKQDLMAAQTDTAYAQGRKYGEEADSLSRRNKMQSDDEILRTVAMELGYGDPQEIQDQIPINPSLGQRFNRGIANYRGMLAQTGDTNFDQFQKGVTTANDRRIQEDVLSGRVSPYLFGASVGAREGKDMVGVEGGTRFSKYLLDDPMTTTAVGESAIRRNDAQASNYNASAARNTALANNPRGTAPLDISPSEATGLQDLILSSMGVTLEDVDPDALSYATEVASQAYQQTRNAGAAASAGMAALEPYEDGGVNLPMFGNIGGSQRFRAKRSVGDTVAPTPQSVDTQSAPPAALEFYRQNRGAPGIREQFIQKYGFDPEA